MPDDTRPPSDSNEPDGPTTRTAWIDRHLWQIQPVRDVLLGLAVVGLFWLGERISVVTVPLLLAMLLAYLFEPVIKHLTAKTRLDRRGSVAVILGAAVLLVMLPTVLGAVYGVGQVATLLAGAAEKTELVYKSVADPENEVLLAQVKENAGESWFSIRNLLAESAEDPGVMTMLKSARDGLQENAGAALGQTAGAGVDVARSAVSLVGGTFSLAFAVFLTGFFFYFVSNGWSQVQRFGLRLLPDRHRALSLDLAKKFDAVIAGFVRGRLTIAFAQAIFFSIAYMLIGVPASFILGPAVAILSIVPYLAMVGIPVSVGLLWLEGHTGFRGAWWWVFGAPLGVYFLGQALDDYVLTPAIQGKSTGMDTPTILFATLAGGALFGVFGMLIAIPIAACLKIVIQELAWPRFKEWAEGRRTDPLPID